MRYYEDGHVFFLVCSFFFRLINASGDSTPSVSIAKETLTNSDPRITSEIGHEVAQGKSTRSKRAVSRGAHMKCPVASRSKRAGFTFSGMPRSAIHLHAVLHFPATLRVTFSPPSSPCFTFPLPSLCTWPLSKLLTMWWRTENAGWICLRSASCLHP